MSSPTLLLRAVCVTLVTLAPMPAFALDATNAAPGSTRVARWKNDKQAAFQLMFDDGLASHLKNVIPELQKRGMVGTFYINPAKADWQAAQEKWKEVFITGGMVPADHTMTHKGVKDVPDAEEEIGHCADIMRALVPGKPNYLMSFGQPGVAKGAWAISKDQLKTILTEHHLIDRPDFSGRGAMIAFKDATAMLAHVDKALAAGSSECIVFHGVGAEYITTPMPIFLGLLDGLETRRDRLWITDHISAYKYAAERDGAMVRTLDASPAAIHLNLTTTTDPMAYDAPLTLVTRAPAGWTRCQVAQGTSRSVVAVTDGSICFDALPGAQPILLQATTASLTTAAVPSSAH